MKQWRTWTVNLMCVFLLGGSPAYAEKPEAAGEETVPAQEAQDGIQERGLGTSQQPLIDGSIVPVQRQQDIGLVSVARVGRGSCSGTLLNRFWVLTAAHCVTSDGNPASPPLALNLLQITATWSSQRPIPTRVVHNLGGSGLDVALIFLGGGDFGAVNTQILFKREVEKGMTLTSYGRGIFKFASAGPPPVPADAGGGLYRSARFVASNQYNPNFYTLPVNNAGQVGEGGDSGGPDFVVAAPNTKIPRAGLGIAGVHSICHPTGYVPGQPANWTWATGVDFCNSTTIFPVLNDILQIIHEDPRFLPQTTIKDPISKFPSLSTPPGIKQSAQVNGKPAAQTAPLLGVSDTLNAQKVLPTIQQPSATPQSSPPLLLKPSTTTTLNSSTSLNGGIFLRGVPQEGSPPAGTPPAKPKPAP